MNYKTTLKSNNNFDWHDLAYTLNKAEIDNNKPMAIIMNEDTADDLLKDVQKIECKSQKEVEALKENGIVINTNGFGILFKIIPRKVLNIPHGTCLVVPKEWVNEAFCEL